MNIYAAVATRRLFCHFSVGKCSLSAQFVRLKVAAVNPGSFRGSWCQAVNFLQLT